MVDSKGVLQYAGAIDPSPQPETIQTATNYIDVAVPQVLAGSKPSYTTTRPCGCSVKY